MNYGPDESMDGDEIGEDEDAEMDFGEETGSEDTSRTDDDMDEEDDDEVDVDDETGESEGGWQDEEEDGAGLVENGEEVEGDDDGDDDDDEDEEADDGVIWPEVCFPACTYHFGSSFSCRELSKFRERQMRATTRKASEVAPVFCFVLAVLNLWAQEFL